jgi:hypothetical protein
METANTQRPMKRTLAVIDGGLDFKPGIQTVSTTQKRSYWSKSGKPFGRGTTAI